MENLQKTSKKTPALVWLFAYKSKIAKKKNISTLKSKQLSLQKKYPPKNFVDCAKKKINVRPPYKKKYWTYKKIIEKLKKSICPPHFLSKIKILKIFLVDDDAHQKLKTKQKNCTKINKKNSVKTNVSARDMLNHV